MAMKQAAKYSRGILYKIRKFRIPVYEPVFIFGDNQSVLVNASAPEYTPKKKIQSIAFNFICKGCATNEWGTTYIHT